MRTSPNCWYVGDAAEWNWTTAVNRETREKHRQWTPVVISAVHPKLKVRHPDGSEHPAGWNYVRRPEPEFNPLGGALRGAGGRCTCPAGKGTDPGCPVHP